MDVTRLIHKALSDDDIGTILGADANIIRYSELSHISDLDKLLTKDLEYCIILYERQTGQRPLDRFVKSTTVSMSTSISMAISPTSRLSGSL